MKQENIKLDAVVVEDLSNSIFKCETDNGISIICTISGKLRINNIRILVGDKVQVAMSPYDLTKGRIELRYNTTNSDNFIKKTNKKRQ